MYLSSWQKRALDLFCCWLSVWIFGPIAFIIGIMIFLEERKQIFFLQERVGFRQKPFMVYKFRTMTNGKPTRVGQWLRKTGLDELPQFINVIKGDISIVGPRPLTALDIERLQWRHLTYRWEMQPGITGLAQIWAGQGAQQSLEADYSYFHNASLGLDFKIIFISFLMNLFGKRRVQSFLHR